MRKSCDNLPQNNVMKNLVLLFALLSAVPAFSQKDCEKAIHYEYSSFNSEHRFFTPMQDEKGRDERIYVEKAVSKGVANYFIHLKVYHPTYYTALVELSIAFIDGTKIVRRQQMIEVKSSKITDFFESTTLFRINENEFKSILTKRVGSFRIQTDDFKISAEEGMKLKEDIGCLKNAQVPK
ncbi:hypothetical protein Runsl_0878 [Runella slithyformis DSM 19594]|uniref:DUF4468 domain-containing protein n=2 Tax=Runella TaxID=105 RepID=A0A7U3ZHK9_RUNSL|nr:hypothetical protein Runsl_0878 [Runella slithyformis DSM 19594]